MESMKYKRLICGGLLLIAAALCLTVFNICQARLATQSALNVLRELEAKPAFQDDIPEAGQPAQESEAEPAIPAYVLDPSIEMPTIEVDGEAYIGILEIPALELSLPIISQWSDNRLRLAPCRYDGSAYLNDLIIAGHNYRGHFGRLKDLQIGDAIYFTDEEDNRFSYTVSELDELAGSAIEEMEAGDWDLTLFTCTMGGKARVTVRCKKDM